VKRNKTFISKDGVEYTLLVTEDIIKLEQKQIDTLGEQIASMNSDKVESNSGVPLHLWREEQNRKVVDTILEILSPFESIQEILDSEIIDYTGHAKKDRISNVEICIERDWNPDKVEYEIAETLKHSYKAEQVRIRFDPVSKESWPRFGFTITGLKNGEKREPGKIVIHFAEDPVDTERTIMVITILKPEEYERLT
jgi:hypothetical protein